MNPKRILLIVLFVILVLAFGAFIYFVLIRDIGKPLNIGNQNVNGAANTNSSLPVINGAENVNQYVPVNENTNVPTINTTPSVNRAQFDPVAAGGETQASVIVSDPSQAAAPAVDGNGLRYYDADEGKFYTIDKDGNAAALSEQTFPEAREIEWSPTSNQAVIGFPDNTNILYNFDTGVQVTLPKEWEDIEFSTTGDQIGFLNLTDDERARWLATANPDGSDAQLLEPLGDNADDVDVNWSPSGQVVALFRESYNADGQEAFLIGLHGENFKSIITDGRGFEGLWSPDGSRLLYNVFNADSRYNPVLHLVDASGDLVGANDVNLELQTWVSRCAFSKLHTFAYCAVPQYLPTGSGLFPDAAGTTNDSIYRIDTRNGSKTIIAMPRFSENDQYTVESLFLSSDEATLYYVDGEQSKVFSIALQ
ncbi:MAG: hypothetical protein WC505_04655 [Patescibacteria group bacterium]